MSGFVLFMNVIKLFGNRDSLKLEYPDLELFYKLREKVEQLIQKILHYT